METLVEIVKMDGLHVALWLHTQVDPLPQEWDAGINLQIEYLAKRAVPREKLRTLVVSDGGAPNTRQRRRMTQDLWKDRPSKISVITTALSNPIKRGIATALSWANPATRFFQPAQVREALRHIDLEPRLADVWVEWKRMQRQIRTIKTLGLIAQALELPAID